MSGSKRRTAYRKQVTDSVLHDSPEPVPGFSEVVQIVRSQGSNLLEVRGADGSGALAILPTKFRRLVWIKRNDFVIASQSHDAYETAGGASGRVKFMIEHILYPAQIKHLMSSGKWPAAFAAVPPSEPDETHAAAAGGPEASSDADAECAEDMPAMWRNTNRRQAKHAEDSSSEEEGSDDGDDAEETVACPAEPRRDGGGTSSAEGAAESSAVADVAR